jgi:hypothetical protein
MRNFIVVLFCLVSVCCFGQVKVLKLPTKGDFNKVLKFKEGDTVTVIRSSFSFPSDTVKICKPVTFYKIIITKSMLMAISFEKESTFSYVTFDKSRNFNFISFQNEVNFNSSIFKGEMMFYNLIFHKDASFNDSYFEGNTYFNLNLFDIYADFAFTKGNGELFFSKSQMPNIIDFSSINSLKLDFRDVFTDSLKTRKISFPKWISNEDSILRIKLFEASIKSGKCVIKLKRTNLSNIILPYSHFWADTTGYSFEEKTTLYEKLIKKCKDEGMDESVIGWSIELKKVDNKHSFPILGDFLNWFQAIFWNYGFTKSLILLWILGVFLFFNIINFFIYPQLINVYFNPKLGLKLIAKPLIQDEQAVIGILKKNRYTRLRYMLHYTGMIFFGIKLEHTDMSFKHLGWVALLYFEFVTGIVLLGFALNFVVSK